MTHRAVTVWSDSYLTSCASATCGVRRTTRTYQEGAEHVEGDEIDYCESTAACHLLSGVVVGLWVAQFPWHTGQHDLLPGLPGGTSGGTNERHITRTTLTRRQSEA